MISKPSLGALTLFAVALATYTWTLAPTVTLVDSGELIAAAKFFGNAHPPGFPLYLVMANLATLVPFGNVAVRVNFASAVFAAAAAAILYRVVTELLLTSSASTYESKNKRSSGKKFARRRATVGDPGSVPIAKPGNQRLPLHAMMSQLLPAMGAGLLLAFSRTLWSYATIAEVYTLNSLLIVLIFLLMLRWRNRIQADRGADRLLYLAAVLFGLALGVHHVTVALILPALAVIVYRAQGINFFTSRRLLFAALFSFAALVLIYCYLPLAAAHRPVINWGDPRSFRAIWDHITGKQYQAFFIFSPNIIGQQLADFGKLLLREFGAPWLPMVLLVAFCGYFYSFKRDRMAFWFVTAIVIANMAFGSLYYIAEDKDAYYLPSFISVAILAGFGLAWLQERIRNLVALIAGIAVLLPAIAIVSNWRFDNRHNYFVASDYVDNIEQTIAPNSLLLTLDWQVASPMFYTREIENRRRDIQLVDVNLLRRPWYLDYLATSYPDLVARSKPEFDAFRARLQEWITNPTAHVTSPTWQKQMHDAYHGLLGALITNKIEQAHVYLTHDVLFFAEGEEKELSQWVNNNFQAFPRGLVFELTRDHGFHDPGDSRLQTRGLNDNTMTFERDDVVSLKIIPVYKIMLLNRARYFAYFHQTERAVKAYTETLAFDPNFEVAKRELMENVDKLQPSNPTGR